MPVATTRKRHGRHYTPPELAGFLARGLRQLAGSGEAALAELDDLIGRAFLGALGRRRLARERTL